MPLEIETGNSSRIVSATMQPSGKTFEVLPNQSLLEAGLGAGVALPFGCANGSCGDCRARITAGQIGKIRNHDYSLTEVQKLEGYCLLCSSTAISDVQIEVYEATSCSDIAAQELAAKVCKLEVVNNVSVATFKFVRGKALRFLPGQQATLVLPDGDSVTLPIASCPCNAEIAEFHLIDESSTDSAEVVSSCAGISVKQVEKIVDLASTRKRISISGPSGNFTLSSDDSKPRIFIATGGDFAQLQGMLEQALNNDLETPCCLIWQATEAVGHYRSNLCRSWHDAMDNFSYIPVTDEKDLLSTLTAEWSARLNSCEVYLGRENSELVAQLVERGVEPTAIRFPLRA